jgi:Bacterial sugar transferase
MQDSPLLREGETASLGDRQQMTATSAQEIGAHSSEPGQPIAAPALAGLDAITTAELAGSELTTRRIASGAAIRIFDVVVASSLLLVVLLPLIVLVVIAVRLESPGPAVFRCDRVGYRGRRLRMSKLRKMHHGAQGPSLTADEDARFTRIGGLLAKLKIDEIPQPSTFSAER